MDLKPDNGIDWRTQLTWTVLFGAIMATLQGMQPVPWDGDAGYHLAVSSLIREHGILHEFPWTPFSWFADHYSDRELLFHLLFVPFTGLGYATAAKIGGTLVGTLVLFTLYRIFVAARVPAAGMWTLLVLALSAAFVVRVAAVRPHVLSISLALAIVWAAGQRRWVLLAVATVLYPYCYIAWHMSLILVLIVELARGLSGQRPNWRPPLFVAVLLTIAVCLHPNFPENAFVVWMVVHDILWSSAWGQTPGLSMGGELKPFSFLSFCRFVLPAALITGAALVMAFRHRRKDSVPLAFAIAATAFLAMTLRSQRFIEYLAPFAAAAGALALGPHMSRRSVSFLLGGALLFTALVGRRTIMLLDDRTELFPPHIVARLRAVIPEGAQVFHCDWQFTGEMLLALPNRRFIVSGDPIPFVRKDPTRYRIWYDLIHEPPALPAARIRDTFGASFVLCEERANFIPFFQRLAADPGARLFLHDNLLVAFALSPSEKIPQELRRP